MMGFSFYALTESDEGADKDLIYNFCWPKRHSVFLSLVISACIT